MYKRVFGIVLDSIGVGAAPDAEKYGDAGSDTLGHIGEFFNGDWRLPNLQKLGLGNIRQNNPIQGIEPVNVPMGYYGKMIEVSAGKDSLDGHWEMMGLPMLHEFSTYPNGFPQALLDKIAEFSGRPIIAKGPYSGTEVIKDFGEQSVREGALIIYTSADPVMQIAAHEAVVPLEELYKICEYARTLVNAAPDIIGRIIARPFIGTNSNDYTRTANRHDFALAPTGETDLVKLQNAGLKVIGIGKINDIFSGQGIDEGYHNESNMDGMDHVDKVLGEDFTGFAFTNLVDFDTLYGHRRDPEGMGKELMRFDRRLGVVMNEMRPDDLLIITADHGNDPGFTGSDHTREQVPVLAYSPSMKQGRSLGTRATFADFGATVLKNFGLQSENGTSFLNELA
ncbi:MAG: phosphopentomutase [Lactobacillaceae bacterium]|jgi:phosphopentomutase|nr:phosphopentomutase [Lactobacillaceae bacterium]